MKLTWNKNKNNKKRPLTQFSNLPFDQDDSGADQDLQKDGDSEPREPLNTKQLAESFQSQGNKLAEDGKYREALGKWEAALNLMPENAVLHEQKAQVLLEIGDAWNALKAATRATELEPSWAEAWITLGRAQLNFGEPDSAMESFDKALAMKPDSEEARDDRKTAFHLVKRRKQLHLSGLDSDTNRFVVGDKTGTS
ncbi:tetratricopeptide repeat protein 33 [Pistacia vera]|uniref:tetratricopeptide repeat protein 33 n=1 Tax=Pistacia vera TaxID=55513 RepID=UPI001262C48C|nr:tetratricopeptide repeat protein 33 [Pistacia vera]